MITIKLTDAQAEIIEKMTNAAIERYSEIGRNSARYLTIEIMAAAYNRQQFYDLKKRLIETKKP